MDKNHDNVVQFRKPIIINIGVVIFILLFCYILVCVWIYFTTPQIVAHEVQMGTLTSSMRYKGFIVREETIVTSEYDGFIYYFVREGERVGVKNMVCTIDGMGSLTGYLEEKSMDNSLQSDQDYNIIQREVIQFVHSFHESDFNKVYDFKYNINGTVQRLSNDKLLEEIDQYSTDNYDSTHMVYADTSGIVVYHTDGYESFTEELLSPEIFDLSKYEKNQFIGNELVMNGDSIYKVVTDENWTVYIELTPNEAMEIQADIDAETGLYNSVYYIEVKFLDSLETSWAIMNIIQVEDQFYGKLEFNNSMYRFASDRYVDFELIREDEIGFKIPRSAIADREFFLIPKDYIIAQGATDNIGVMRESYTEDGLQTIEFVNVSIYQEGEEDYYIDSLYLTGGDYIVKPDSVDKYPISKTGSLIGVYNINKGYADFNQVTILYQNDEYAIVESNTKYGLHVYDYIVLDAVSVEADDFIY